MPKILVIRGGALGDFILTLPVLAALRCHFPQHDLEVLGDPRFASLAIAGGLADNATPLDSPALASFFASDSALSPDFVQYFSRFDLISSYLYDPERTFQSNISRCTPAKFIAGPHRPDEASETHATDQLLQCLAKIGIHDADPIPQIALPVIPDRSDVPRIALHPGSGSEKKNWPESHWKELLQLLAQETNWNFLLIGGEAEGARTHRLSAELPSHRVEVAQNLPLVVLAQKMKSCTTFIGHDSGITHLAAALDLPGLILWGATAARIWRPRNEKLKLLHAPNGLSDLTVQTVFKTFALAPH